VVSIALRDLEQSTLDVLEDFFRQVAANLKVRRKGR